MAIKKRKTKRKERDFSVMSDDVSLQKRKESDLPHLVWDLDSSLPFPSPLATYVAETIRPSFQLFSEFQR